MQEEYERELAKISEELFSHEALPASEFEVDWQAESVKLPALVECREENPSQCRHSISNAGSWYCSYPPVVHVAKKFCVHY